MEPGNQIDLYRLDALLGEGGMAQVYRAWHIVAYEMLYGGLPFGASADASPISLLMCHLRDQPRPPIEWQPHLALFINAALLRALAKNPQERFPCCLDFSNALAGNARREESLPRVSMAASPALLAAGGAALSVPQETSLPPARRIPVATYWSIGIVALAGVGLVSAGLLKQTAANDSPAPPLYKHVDKPGDKAINDSPAYRVLSQTRPLSIRSRCAKQPGSNASLWDTRKTCSNF